MPVKPATWRRRILAQTADLSLMGMALVLVARVLPDGPPPADAMAFFTQQDFINYFSLVTLALALTVAVFQSVVVTHATPGQYLLKLRLVTLDGQKPSREHVNTRQTRALINMLLILLPGPVIALIVGATAAALLNIPFTQVRHSSGEFTAVNRQEVLA
jgi:RDD family